MTPGASFIIFLFAEGVQCPQTLMRYPYDNRRKADFRPKGSGGLNSAMVKEYALTGEDR